MSVTQIKELVAQNKLKQALQLAGQLSKHSDLHQDVLGLSAKFQRNHRQERLGTISLDEANRVNMQIANGLLDLLNEFAESTPLPDETENTSPLKATETPAQQAPIQVNVYNTNTSESSSHSEASAHVEIDISLSINGLKGAFEELQGELSNAPYSPELVEARQEVAQLEEQIQQLEGVQQKEDVPQGPMNKIRRWLEKVQDPESSTGQVIKTIGDGIGIAQDVAKHYNSIAEWCGLPQVPKLFLKA
ncbi:hypothetical protein AAG747_10815 [Rapidithrix thailandica]|uniref:Effector-associated domain-containing protein n=1 Tax=Rapidithrix thailandica TaxID=413964 RepID=A0AAW9RXD5_9BACT